MGHGFSGMGNLTIDFVADKKEYFWPKTTLGWNLVISINHPEIHKKLHWDL